MRVDVLMAWPLPRIPRLATVCLIAVLALLVGLGELAVAPADATTSTCAGQGVRPAPIIYRPGWLSPTAQAPLVIALHGSPGTPTTMQGTTHFEQVADEHGFEVAYLGSPCPASWKNVAVDDPYISSEIDQLVGAGNVDPRRVYVSGVSAGGYITYFVGCGISSKVAAIAVVSSAMLNVVKTCQLSHPVSELTIIGTSDAIPINGGPNLRGAAPTANLWASLDGCTGARSIAQLTPATQATTWNSCTDGSAVGLYVIQGGHHAWPGTYGLAASDPDAQYNASEGIWAFFAAHPWTGSATLPSASLVSLRYKRVGQRRRVLAAFRLAEAVTVTESLTARGRTFVTSTLHLGRSALASPILGVPRKAKRGNYMLEIRVQDSYGRSLSLLRKIRVAND
jgi:polyhydroxybutyrate depolymerase